MRSRGGRRGVPRRLGKHSRRRRASAPVGLRDEGRDRGRGARRRRGGDRLARRPGGTARFDPAPPARPRLGPAVRRNEPIARPAAKRIYSNTGIELAAEHVAQAAGMPFTAYFEAVWGFPLEGSPAHGLRLPLTTLIEVARELQRPTRIAAETHAEMVTTQFPGLDGVVPGRRAVRAERLGPRPGASRRQASALDRERATRHGPSATSGAAVASSGSTRKPGSRLPSSPTSSSATGRSRRGRGSPTPSSPRA